MGVRVLEGEYDGGPQVRAVLIDSVTETAFGPMFADTEEADGFLEWHRACGGKDVRTLDGEALADRVHEYRTRML